MAMAAGDPAQKMSLPRAREEFMNIIRNIDDPETTKNFLSWIKWNWLNSTKTEDESDDLLKTIADDIKEVLPPDAVLPSENISTPLVGENADCDPRHTLHVDAFLYDDEQVDDMCEDGRLDRNYCLQCGSHKTRPLTFISHSASRERLRYIFRALLPPLEREGTVILDVGSRLGAVLYAAYIYTKATKIFGVEINKDFCNLQRDIIKKYNFQDRVVVLEGDVTNAADVIRAADVIVMNNVFEFFMPAEKQVAVWRLLRAAARPGALLVTVPALEAAFAHLQTGIDLTSWVRPVPPHDPEAPGLVDIAEEAEHVRLYEVM
ncbi:uncharacterized protein LOC124552495 [Schistocerca americana]|uniref:uncharacterized protein LOC124552495 n=1 Tax=Schistocerca americana TaxID=7009 RepID=UPI001F4F2A72|nr:uncharacterized protein LOC124552495 [Schistocerca americana]XP_047100498.1 uncharacterized protein LOC124718894 [Schistocerca piceifrons]XP_049770936.1 uncharacterized protein LOC126109890 [Schistocerca cancellata]XP_049797962.1 uncharacterized protein LOC126215323 isoform X2 [Schistocerca nitens]XP_049842501.1 uncharacterized protein LOC126293350 [Schistocerca gregaria]XP_049946160.1 uncharacterized protein LOC126428286 [Schistocerca serialis cubense]